jgi:hypothetical protein
MKRFVAVIAIMIVLCVSAPFLYAHICHSIFMTPGLLAVRPEKDVSTLSKSDEFKVYAQNNYIAPLTNIKLTAAAEDSDVDVKVTPEAITRLLPGERGEFTVNISVKDTKQRNFPLKFNVTAKQLKMRPVDEPTAQELRASMKRSYTCGQIYAAEALIRLGHADGAEFLKQVIRMDPEVKWHKRSVPVHNAGRAARLVGRMGHKEFAPYLRERYKVEKSDWVRGHILLGLASLGLQEDKDLFIKAANDSNGLIRTCGLLSQVIRGDKDASQQLKAGMSDANVMISILSAWGRSIVKDEEGIKILKTVVYAKDRKKYYLPDLPGDSSYAGGGEGSYIARVLAGEALLDLAARGLRF